MTWNESNMQLGDERIDADHQQFFTLLERAAGADDAEFAALFLRINQHLNEHFAHEDALMQQHQFSAKAEHQAEHRRVLGEMHQFKSRVERGRISMARSYLIDGLPGWFRLHVVTMDSALVVCLQKSC